MSELRASGMRSRDRNTSQSRAAEATDGQEVAERRFVSPAVAHQMFGLSRTTWWRLLKAGEIEGVRVGRTLRLSVVSIEAFLETRKVSKRRGR